VRIIIRIKKSNTNQIPDSDTKEIVAEENFIIIVSAETNNQGEILQVSEGIFNILGYKPSDVIGRKNEIFMPPCIQKNHHRYISRFTQRMDQDILNVPVPIYTRTKESFYRLSAINCRLSPSLSYGLHFISVIFSKHDVLEISGKPIDIQNTVHILYRPLYFFATFKEISLESTKNAEIYSVSRPSISAEKKIQASTYPPSSATSLKSLLNLSFAFSFRKWTKILNRTMKIKIMSHFAGYQTAAPNLVEKTTNQ
jgi:hypothetical protein